MASPSRRRAFTVTELLVVIAVVGILAAILFPMFATVRENGRRTACASNLKQIGLAWTQYTADYDDRTPLYYAATTPSEGLQNFTPVSLLDPYTKTRKIWRCPGEAKERPVGGASQQSDSLDGNCVSYGYNFGPWIGPYPAEGKTVGGFSGPIVASASNYYGFSGISTAAVANASQTFLFGDAAALGVNSLSPAFLTEGSPTSQSSARHRGLKNMLYADGHVKAIAWRVGVGTLPISGGFYTYIAVPQNRSDYDSYCTNVEEMVDVGSELGGLKRCGDAMPIAESKVTSWLP